jgi:RNA 3'-terminal phosphate cyclase (ATP)
MSEHIDIDGSQGEGGGQILRSALALSLITGRPFRITAIRAGRAKPGLLRQHLTAVQAACAIGGTAAGAELGASALTFTPGPVRGGEYRLAVGTAGSTTLVLQAVLPALLLAREPSRLTLEGGTHNPSAPPFDFLARTFVPVLRRMGVGIELAIETHGFHPAGGGRITVDIAPSARLTRVALTERGPTTIVARALIAGLPERIARRELDVVRERLGLDRSQCLVERLPDGHGPGNVLLIDIASADGCEIVSGFGRKGVVAEKVAEEAVARAEAFLAAGVPVGEHLADQLLVPMALAGGGAFRTVTPTAHTHTNADVIRRFLEIPIRIDRADGGDAHHVTIGHGKDGTT